MRGLDDRTELATFLVEHYWPGITVGVFEAACRRVRVRVDEIAREGLRIRFVHSTLVAEEESAFCLFEAESAAAVAEAYARAEVPFERVLDALQIGTGPETHRLPDEHATTAAQEREER